MQHQKPTRLFKLAAVSAAIALSGAAYAASNPASVAETTAPTKNSVQEQRSPDAQHGMRGHHRHGGKHFMHGKHRADFAMLVPGYGPLNKTFVDGLGLNEDQTKLLSDARQAQQEARKARREAFKAQHGKKLEQVKSGKIDPEAAMKAAQDGHEKLADSRADVQKKWLAVWDSLDAGQQAKVAVHLQERAEKFAQHVEKRKERRANRQAGQERPSADAPSVAPVATTSS